MTFCLPNAFSPSPSERLSLPILKEAKSEYAKLQ